MKTVELVPIDGVRGAKAIMVDGVQWGTAHLQSAGANGAYYWFEQIGDPGEISRVGTKVWRGSNRTNLHPVKVWGDKMAMRKAGVSRSGIGPAAEAERLAFPSLETRLLTEINNLITEGLLKNPEIVAVKKEEARRLWREAEARSEASEEAEFKRRAEECLVPLAEHIGDNMKAAMVADIIKAMRWAQTK